MIALDHPRDVAAVHHRVLLETTPPRSGTVLVIDEDDDSRDSMARALVREGYCVLTCAGPIPPTYRCPGGHDEECPFAAMADAIVLDLRLEADSVMEGVPGWQLLSHYESLGKPVVAVSDDPVAQAGGDRVAFLRGTPTGRELSSVLRRLASASTGVIDVRNHHVRTTGRKG